MRVLCIGWYGHGLVGDEAILAVLVRDLPYVFPQPDVCVTTSDAEATSRRYRVRTIGFSLTEIAEEIARADLVVLGGGGLFTEYTPYRPLSTLRGTPDFTTLCGEIPALCAVSSVPCAIFSVGVDTLHSAEAKAALRRAFLLAGTASVRDSGSLSIVRGELGPEQTVALTCDPAAALTPASLERSEALRMTGLDQNAPVLTLSLRHWDTKPFRLCSDPQPWEGVLAEALVRFCQRHDAQVLAAPHQREGDWIYSNDHRFYERFFRRLGAIRCAIWDGPLDPETIAAVQALGDAHLAMRHHGVVLAAATRTPCGALAYSEKVVAAMRDAGLADYVLSLSAMEGDGIENLLERLWNDRETIKKRLADRADRTRELYKIALETLKAALAPDARSERERALAETAARWRSISCSSTDPLVQSVEQLLATTFSCGMPAQAVLPVLEELANAGPHVGAFHYYLGYARLLCALPEKARDSFTTALSLDFKRAWTLSMRGDAREHLADLRGAADDHRAALATDPSMTRSREALERLESGPMEDMDSPAAS
jgi:polysaccharide pyruvyl transferase WcaK-like protein